MNKIDVLGWGVVAGILALAGYVGVKSANKLPWLNERSSADLLQTPGTSILPAESLFGEREKVAESSQAWDEWYNENSAQIAKYPELNRAILNYTEERGEALAALNNYTGESWTDYYLLTKEVSESNAALASMNSAYQQYLLTQMRQN
jgi:hypothetical protein